MSYELLKPYTKEEKFDFIIKYNHNQGLKIEENENALIALEKNEIIDNGKIIIDTDSQKNIEKEFEKQKLIHRLEEIDKKRIRAVCENEIKDETTGQTWLDYYNKQVIDLRKKLQTL